MDRPPKLIVLSGLPGVGKSSIAREIATQFDATWLRVDTLEAAMLSAGIAHSFETGLAAYQGCHDMAADQLRLGRSVVVDAVNGVEPARQMWRDLAQMFRAERYTIHVVCTDLLEHRRRVEVREAPTPPLPKPTWEEVTHREFQPWTEAVLVVDTAGRTGSPVERIIEFIQADAPST
ncbi:MAG: ATP-binding protein [Thermoplasmata archaeon]